MPGLILLGAVVLSLVVVLATECSKDNSALERIAAIQPRDEREDTSPRRASSSSA